MTHYIIVNNFITDKAKQAEEALDRGDIFETENAARARMRYLSYVLADKVLEEDQAKDNTIPPALFRALGTYGIREVNNSSEDIAAPAVTKKEEELINLIISAIKE